mmetsp:Transcript_2255/g.2716  ORF Transcript_2255/g.2716 Transcript_2255/m.2716 type:complete len:298 (-) Transcript_2255:291-1184(-)
MTDLYESEISNIAEALSEREETTISGARLHEVILNTSPDVNIRDATGILKGPGALTKFAEDFLSHIIVRHGNSGGDVRYQITSNTAAGVERPKISAIHWKTFVSSNANNILVWDEKRNNLLSLSVTEAESYPQNRQIVGITLNEHIQMREHFPEILDDELNQAVKQINQDELDYREWLSRVKKLDAQIFYKWSKFRLTEILKLLEDRLQNLNFNDSEVRLIKEKMHKSKDAAYSEYKKQKPRPEEKMAIRHNERESNTHDNTQFARSLAKHAIDVMSDEDLRAIRIPLGVFIDYRQV